MARTSVAPVTLESIQVRSGWQGACVVDAYHGRRTTVIMFDTIVALAVLAGSFILQFAGCTLDVVRPLYTLRLKLTTYGWPALPAILTYAQLQSL